jgi:hypothetical protein
MQDTSGFRFSNLRLPGNGMYNVQQTKGRYTKFERSYGAPKMIAELRVRYSDGKSETIATDSQWQVAPGPIRFSSTYGGEDFDARAVLKGWNHAVLQENGAPIEKAQGVSVRSREDARAVLHVGSGSYRFTSSPGL